MPYPYNSDLYSERIDNAESLEVGGVRLKRVVLFTADGDEIDLGPITTPSAVTSGRKAVSSAGTAERIVASSTPCKYVYLSAALGNTNPVVVGGSGVVAANNTQAGIVLIPGNDPIRVDIDDLNKLYVDAQTNNDAVCYSYFN